MGVIPETQVTLSYGDRLEPRGLVLEVSKMVLHEGDKASAKAGGERQLEASNPPMVVFAKRHESRCPQPGPTGE